ncbi:FIST C-terminal domain-containing protein [Alphaproteobacteria bacterium]|nr:FIST C-terminal domain-containing protein [Alphaproteobacteria bacterium]
MSVTTSSQFASSVHGGADWREAAKKVLDDLQSAKTDGATFNLGFIYLSDHLAKDARSILNLFRSVLEIEHWVGSVGFAVCGSNKMRVDEPAIAAMVGTFPGDQFEVFAADDHSDLELWLEHHNAMMVLSHAHPGYERDIHEGLTRLEEKTNGFCIGGISTCRPEYMPEPFEADAVAEDKRGGVNTEGGIDGVAFRDDVPVVMGLSQGCSIIGGAHVISRGEENIIYEFESGLPQEVFEEDLRQMAIEKIGKDPNEIVTKAGHIPQEFEHVFSGEVLAAFPLRHSDTGEYLVRNIMGLGEDGSMMVGRSVMAGERVMFVHRDDHTVQSDLSTMLIDLRKRIEKDHGSFEAGYTIKGGIFVSCSARALNEDHKPNHTEMELIKDILGEFPLCGFYAGGEIKGTRLFGYTGILTLFL